MNDRTLLVCTDNTLDTLIARTCQYWLKRNGENIPIVCVSFIPTPGYNHNIVVGNLPRSGITIDIMIRKALEYIQTEWTILCEHDCLYSKEHLRYIPEEKKKFYYNDNNWLLQYDNPNHPEWNGVFSYRRHRKVQSQLIANTDRYRDAMTTKLAIVTHQDWINTYPSGRIAEPGCCDYDRTMLITRKSSVKHLRPQILHYMNEYKCLEFKTKEPNIDIRHRTNFTGQRRGNYRRTSLHPWGTMKDIFDAAA